ncbi:Uncharacterised protein (plasmid) [Tsukamurella tyrosinosolvens]|uniref:hypothetical protein n=1 Tax=Tsukamurella tyrosinosolvens TaxID=57704 RepID=UPI000AA79A0F|nr:hypothetical protein [Tsukamurella tyrosinosolvens]VEH93992.1 Uncharacterised protein [Tsukamurella tyrosinosolvens]
MTAGPVSGSEHCAACGRMVGARGFGTAGDADCPRWDQLRPWLVRAWRAGWRRMRGQRWPTLAGE